MAHYLERGYRLVARNWRCRLGEIDVILARGSILVFCEVKARRSDRFGGAFEAVTVRKQAKVRALAEAFLSDWPTPPEQARFDVASVMVDRRGVASIEVFESAF